MKRNEDVGHLLARQIDPLPEFQVAVVASRKHRPDHPCRFKLPGKLPRRCKRDVLFTRFRPAYGARVLATMTGIDEDRPF